MHQCGGSHGPEWGLEYRDLERKFGECATCELQDASRSLFLTIAYAMKLDRLCGWLAKVLNCRKGS